MKLTKFEHSCVVLEEAGQKLVIDPGAYTQNLPDISNVVALVITHEHPDHFDLPHIQKIAQENPDVLIFVPEGLDIKFDNQDSGVVHAVGAGEEIEVAPFSLKFFGGLHAQVHKSFPRPANIGVLVNKTVYYSGDSFDKPDVKPDVLLAPVSAPWLKIGETIDFVDELKPRICIPTHNALNSEIANSLTELWLKGVCEKHNISFQHLNPGDTIDC